MWTDDDYADLLLCKWRETHSISSHTESQNGREINSRKLMIHFRNRIRIENSFMSIFVCALIRPHSVCVCSCDEQSDRCDINKTKILFHWNSKWEKMEKTKILHSVSLWKVLCTLLHTHTHKQLLRRCFTLKPGFERSLKKGLPNEEAPTSRTECTQMMSSCFEWHILLFCWCGFSFMHIQNHLKIKIRGKIAWNGSVSTPKI